VTDSVSVILISRTLEEARRAASRLPVGADEVLLVTNPPGVPAVHPAWMRNKGAERARGSILCFFDDDVSIEGDLNWFRARPEAWWTAQSFYDATGDADTGKICATCTLAARQGFWFGAIGGFFVLRRSAFRAVGGFQIRSPGEDLATARRLYNLGIRMHSSPFRVTFHRTIPMLGKLLERFPEWSRFPRPDVLPIVRQVPTAVYLPMTGTQQ
jgi:hypothetical protein